jgi:hypothetical protein
VKMFPGKLAEKGKKMMSSGKIADARQGGWVYTQGVGDYYGTAMKNPVGHMRDASVGFRPVNAKQLGTKPRSVV